MKYKLQHNEHNMISVVMSSLLCHLYFVLDNEKKEIIYNEILQIFSLQTLNDIDFDVT